MTLNQGSLHKDHRHGHSKCAPQVCTVLIVLGTKKELATVGAEKYRGVAGGPTSMEKDVVHAKHTAWEGERGATQGSHPSDQRQVIKLSQNSF